MTCEHNIEIGTMDFSMGNTKNNLSVISFTRLICNNTHLTGHSTIMPTWKKQTFLLCSKVQTIHIVNIFVRTNIDIIFKLNTMIAKNKTACSVFNNGHFLQQEQSLYPNGSFTFFACQVQMIWNVTKNYYKMLIYMLINDILKKIILIFVFNWYICF